MRIAIIGAGPSGLAAAKALLAEPRTAKFDRVYITVFERRRHAGGAWNYTPFGGVKSQQKPQAVPSIEPCKTDHARPACASADEKTPRMIWDTPMYRDLYTNIPAALMAYNERPFPSQSTKCLDGFPHRTKVLEYIQDYAKDVLEHIRFDCEVTSIQKSDAHWQIKWEETRTEERAQHEAAFDRVIMASGHYEVPKIPEIPGIRDYDQTYPHRVRHSKYYRSPEEYKGQKVLVVGSGPSAIDISAQLASRDNPIYRSTRSSNPTLAMNSSHIEIVSEISRLNTDGTILLIDGTLLHGIDILMFCTGYLYSFPPLKLDPDQQVVSEDGEYLLNLYRQLIYIPDPTIAFLAMQMSIVPFPLAEAQSCFLARLWSGRFETPSIDDMIEAERRIMKNKGRSRRCMVLGHPEDGNYINSLRDDCLVADNVGGVGMLPVDWLNSERVELRQNTKRLKEEWLRLKDAAQQ